MQLNEERVKLFATILRLMTNPEIIKQLDTDEAFDYEALVRAIAEMVPYPQRLPIDTAAPVIYPAPSPNTIPNWPNWTPMQPLICDPSRTTICSGGTSDQTGCAGIVDPKATALFPSAMSQADGMGDDSGTRGD